MNVGVVWSHVFVVCVNVRFRDGSPGHTASLRRLLGCALRLEGVSI